MQHVYLSYPETESGLAYRLVGDLQAAGYPVFMDAVSDVGSMAWAAETRRAIRGSGAVVMLLHLAGARRTGMRHEGIAAQRRDKPVIVGALSVGEVPRYLMGVPLIDFSGAYDVALNEVLTALPDVRQMITAQHPLPRHRRAALPGRVWWQRPVWWAVLLGAVLVMAGAALMWL